MKKLIAIITFSISSALISYSVQATTKVSEPHTHSAKKAGVKQWKGMKLEVTKNGLTVDSKPAAVSETNKDATVYQQGLFSYIVYANGKIAVMDDKNQFQGYAK